MKKQAILYFVLIACAFFVACSKDPVPSEEYFFMDQEFKDYTFFRKGSWWVYQLDSATEDSVYVDTSFFSLLEPDTADYSWQESYMRIHSSYAGDTTALFGNFLKDPAVFYLRQKNDSGEILNYFSLKPPGYIFQLSSSLHMRYVEVKDTTLNGLPFGAVMIFENLASQTNSYLPKTLWYARNIGIIRKELYNGQVWYLNRYNVVQ